jgi:IS30 family transposase
MRVSAEEKTRRGRPPALTEPQARQVVRLAAQGVSTGELAAEFSVHPATIARIVRRERDWVRGRSVAEILERLE